MTIDLVDRLLQRAELAKTAGRVDEEGDLRDAADTIIGCMSAIGKLKARVKELSASEQLTKENP